MKNDSNDEKTDSPDEDVPALEAAALATTSPPDGRSLSLAEAKTMLVVAPEAVVAASPPEVGWAEPTRTDCRRTGGPPTVVEVVAPGEEASVTSPAAPGLFCAQPTRPSVTITPSNQGKESRIPITI